jgi:uncharacterized protein YoxC
MNDCERRLVRNLKEKETELQGLKKSLEVVNAEKRELLSKVEFLERISEDRNQELNRTR